MFVKSQFEGLVGKIRGLRKLEVGIDISRVDYACDLFLYTEFDDATCLPFMLLTPSTSACGKRWASARHLLTHFVALVLEVCGQRQGW